MNPLIGILSFVNCWFTSFLFCGFFLPEDDIPWPLKVHAESAVTALFENVVASSSFSSRNPTVSHTRSRIM